MNSRWAYINLILTGIFILSCTSPVVETAEMATIQSINSQTITQPVQKLQPKNLSDSNSDYYTNPAIIKPRKISDQKIGELVDMNLNELVARQTEIENSSWTSIFYSPLNPPVKIKSKWQVGFEFDNDIFDNTDYYYTNGFRLEIVAPFMYHSPIRHILIGSKKAQIDLNGISLRQNIYTPTNPDAEEVLIGDRPFSAYLTIGQFREIYDLRRKLHIRSELNLGVIGPASLGGQVQAQIHEIEPVGWTNQIQNDFVIDYYVRVSKGIINTPIIEFNAVGKANIGTLYNKISGGLDMRFGQFMPVYRGPLSIFEFINPGARLQYWLFLKGEVNVVGYDATMQGGLFNNGNPYTISSGDINRLVFESSIGFAVYYNNIGFEYEHFYQTPEFNGAYHFGWGRIKAVLAF